MIKKITVNLNLDGTGNDKTNDTKNNTHTNIARLHDSIHSDYHFNITGGEKQVELLHGAKSQQKYGFSKLEEINDKPIDGNYEALRELINSLTDIPGDSLNLSLYHSGVGTTSPQGSFQDSLEEATGLGITKIIRNAVDAIDKIKSNAPENIQIELNISAFSRGAVEAKDLMNTIREKYPDGSVHINTAVLFDPVSSVGLTPLITNGSNLNLEDPGELTPSSRIFELYAANEGRRTFPLENYTSGNVHREVFPGAHSQVGGRYRDDILAVGPLLRARQILTEGGAQFDPLPIEDVVRLRIYNAVIENPLLVRTLITDSRIISESLHYPGETSFPIEFPQDYENDNPVAKRGVVHPKNNPELQSFLDKLSSAQPTLESIESFNYKPFYSPDLKTPLPPELEGVLHSFESRLKASADNIEDISSDLHEAYSDLREQLSWLRTETDVEIKAIQALDNFANTLNDRQENLDKYYQNEKQEAEELLHNQELLDSEVNAAGAFSGLMNSIESGDGVSTVRDGLDYIRAMDQYMESRGGKEGFLDNSAESIMGGVKSAISFGQAVDSGNALDIAGESINIVQSIDQYLDSSKSEYGTVIGTKGSAMLGMGEAGITLARAIESDNELEMVQSSVDLVKEIDNYFTITSGNGASSSALDSALGMEAGQTGTVLRGIGSAVALAINIDRMDDVFKSGNAAAITYNVASTVNNAIITYNAAAQLAGAGQLSCGTIPGLGYIAAAAQLAQGDVKGAAITAVSTYLMTLGPYGWIAAAVLQIASMIMGKEGPPEARAVFSLDEDGNIVSTLGGDGNMKKAVEGWVEPVKKMMESYRDNGGRLDIHGNLPILQMIQGEGMRINYHGDGGRVSVIVKDTSRTMEKLMGVLYGRDRGERLDSAVRTARDIHGSIVLNKVAAVMAAHGFTQKGLTWTYGETKEAIGCSYGSGVHAGGGNMGPQGRHFSANSKSISSLPLRHDQIPSRRLGELIKTIGLNSAFTGLGNEMLAMAMAVPGGLPGLASPFSYEQKSSLFPPETNREHDSVRELDHTELATLLQNRKTEIPPAIPAINDPQELQEYLESHWTELLKRHGIEKTGELHADRIYFYHEDSGYTLHPYDSKTVHQAAGDRSPDRMEDRAPLQRTDADRQISGSGQEPEARTPQHQENGNNATALTEQRPDGPVFTMPEDSSLRFLLTDLTGESTSGGYDRLEDSPAFISFGRCEHGRVWQEANGDIRFQPDPDPAKR